MRELVCCGNNTPRDVFKATNIDDLLGVAGVTRLGRSVNGLSMVLEAVTPVIPDRSQKQKPA